MKRIKIGDLFELKTPQGLSYLHFVYKDKELGELIRVLPGIYETRPEELEDIVYSQEKYMVFFPLVASIKRNIVDFVANYKPKNFIKPKYMRTEYNVKGESLGWHIVDTDTWHRELVEDLSNEQIQMSPWGIWNDTLLVERIVENWSLDDWK